MSKHQSLSIWSTSGGLSWYDHATGCTTPQKPLFSATAALYPELDEKPVLRRRHYRNNSHMDVWYEELQRLERKEDAEREQSEELAKKQSIEAMSLEKQRQTLPLNPYFEYMFADAGLEAASDNSIDDLSFDDRNSDSDHIGGKQEFIGPSSPLRPEWEPITPEPEYAEPRFVDASTMTGMRLGDVGRSVTTDVVVDDFLATVDAQLACYNVERLNVSTPLMASPITVSCGEKKRNAIELYEDFDHDEAIDHICVKKARLTLEDAEHAGNQDGRARSVDNKSVVSEATTTRQVSSDFFTHRALAVAPKGYAGQFDGMVIKANQIADFKFNLTDADVFKSNIHFTFGDRLHPNGVFTHKSIIYNSFCYHPDFTKENLADSHPLYTCMKYAEDMTIAATNDNVVILRNHDEEILRREAHIECAYARLEGVTVGYYRYYQGHLSIEEYNEAEMCIC